MNSIEKLGYNNKLVSWKNNKGIQERKKGKDGKYRRKVKRWKIEAKVPYSQNRNPKPRQARLKKKLNLK